MHTVEEALERQKVLAEELNKLLVNTKKDSPSIANVDYMKRKYDEIDKLWSEFHANNAALFQHKTNDQPYFSKNVYHTTKLIHDELFTTVVKKHTIYLERQGVDSGVILNDDEATNSSEHEKKMAEKKEYENNIKTILAIKKIHLEHALQDVEEMELESTSVGEKQMAAEELRNQFTDWKNAFIEVQRLDMYDFDKEGYDMIYKKYVRLCAQLHDAVNAAKNANKGTGHTDGKNTAELPKIKIPDFDGTITKWRIFYELFDQVIDKNGALSGAAKMHFLKTYVKGEAARLISHLSSTAENYGSAYKILISRYENTRVLLGKHLDTILELPQLTTESCSKLKELHDVVFECLRAIENLKIRTEEWDALVTHVLEKKLDNETRRGYECQLTNPKEPQKISDFLKYIESRFMALETYERKEVVSSHENRNSNQQQKTKIQHKCNYCNGQHATVKCDAFMKITENERFTFAKEKKLCMSCLHTNHIANECKFRSKCEKCKRNHNTIMHMESFKKNEKTQKNAKSVTVNEPPKQSIQAMVASNQLGVLLATAIINVYSIHGTPISFRALIDQGSQSAFITENAVQMLRLPRERISATVSGIGDVKKYATHSVKLTITPRMASDFKLQTNAVVLEKLSTNATSEYKLNEWNHIRELQLADPAFNERHQIDIHLGAKEYARIIKDGLVKGDEDTLIAQNTELGWIVSGSLHRNKNCGNINIQAMISTTEVSDLIRKFWEINEIEHRSPRTQEEIDCEEWFAKTHKRLENGRYIVQLPLKNGVADIGQTRNTAVATFLQMERKFAKNQAFYEQYKKFIDEYMSLGHMIECHDQSSGSNYFPHHAVFKESTTTKLRVVFDASRKSSNKKSLNDNLMIGPTIQSNMSTVIMRWRKHKIAFTADIEKMYRQILVHPEHTELQKIIWRDEPNERLREYKLLTVTYGTACAPYLAVRTLQQLAKDEQKNHPKASEIIMNDFYVDDLASGADNVEQALWLQNEIKNTLASGGFNLRKWATNSAELLKAIPECDREVQIQQDMFIDASASIKTLGIRWNPATDDFGFKINISNNETQTKRELLSEIASLFDPLGWIAPVITKAKILIQESWAAGTTWDDTLPQNIRDHWIRLKLELSQIESLRIPRWLKTGENTIIQLHGFCDASESAYAAVIFIKTINSNEEVNVTLLTAKTKVAPLKKEKLTIPKLELCGATMLANLTQQAIEALKVNIETVHLWCDSQVALAWIRGNPNRWKSFVANRVMEINSKFSSDKWHYVRSKENPADCASRGIFPADLCNNELWWHGPKWLHRIENNTDYKDEIIDTTIEEKIIRANVACIQEGILPRTQSFSKLQRIVAYCIRFVHNCKNKKPNGDPITPNEYRNAAKAITHAVQYEYFAEEIKTLRKGGELNNNNGMKKLNPFIDGQGLLRVGGRLTHSALKYDAKHQIIMPYDHNITTLLIKRAHLECMHGGPILTESVIRQNYWIIRGYRRIKSVIYGCATCRRYSKHKMQQYMGDLPQVRVNGIRAFGNCGVDYAGPIAVRTTKGRGHKSVKGYIAVFVCLATKALHLECVGDLSTEAFMAAFRRFAARRGAPANIYSDNGSNFVGANSMLQLKTKEEESEYNKTLYSEMAKAGTQWHFIPPASPNFGGIWEAGVKSVKTHMKKTIGETTLTVEELSTLLCQIEGTLNSRPLCALSADPDDTTPLTPGHFLIGGPLLTLPDNNYQDINVNRLTRWQMIQKMHQGFWKKWNVEYLNRLQERPKWLKKINEPEINDLVLMKEHNLPPARWATGRVIKKHPGQDGLTRVIEVKIGDKTYMRPLSKICMLPGDEKEIITEDDGPGEDEISANVAQISTQPRGMKFSPTKLMLILMGILILTQPAPSSQASCISLTPFEHHPGVYYENIGKVFLSKSKWNIIAYYDVTHYLEELRGIRSSIKNLRVICAEISTNETTASCTENIKQLEEQYGQIEQKNQLLSDSRKSRKRRAVLNIVGNFLGDIFGILGSDFRDKYSGDLREITTNEKYLLKLMQNHTTVTETTLNIVKKDEETLMTQTNRINELIQNIERTSIHQEKVNAITDATFHILMALMRYEARQTNLLNTLLDVHNGQVNANILSPQQLKAQLQKFHEVIDASTLVPGENAHDELRSLYNIMDIQASLFRRQIIFKITVPLIMGQEFQAFNLISAPTRHKNQYIWFTPSTQILLSTLRRDQYYPMTNDEFAHCSKYGDNALICQHRHEIHGIHSTQYACEIQYFNHNGNLRGDCTFRTTPVRDTWIALHEPNKFIYAIYDNTQMDVIYNNRVEHQPISGEGIMTLQPHCIVRHSFVEITGQANYNTAISESILPEINISSAIDSYQKHSNSKLLTFNMSKTGTLEEMIRAMHSNEEKLPETLNLHDIHHYGLGYFLVFIIGTYLVIRFINHQRKTHANGFTTNILLEASTPARPVSMPDLRRENV